MQLEVRKHLFDVLNAIKEIESYAQGLDCSRFLAHGMAQAAVERKFEIIGEALNRLQRVNIPGWSGYWRPNPSGSGRKTYSVWKHESKADLTHFPFWRGPAPFPKR